MGEVITHIKSVVTMTRLVHISNVASNAHFGFLGSHIFHVGLFNQEEIVIHSVDFLYLLQVGPIMENLRCNRGEKCGPAGKGEEDTLRENEIE